MSQQGPAVPGEAPKAPSCFNCGMLGHWAIACPEPTRDMPAGVQRSNVQEPHNPIGHWNHQKKRPGSSQPSRSMVVTRYEPPPPPGSSVGHQGLYPPPPSNTVPFHGPPPHETFGPPAHVHPHTLSPLPPPPPSYHSPPPGPYYHPPPPGPQYSQSVSPPLGPPPLIGLHNTYPPGLPDPPAAPYGPPPSHQPVPHQPPPFPPASSYEIPHVPLPPSPYVGVHSSHPGGLPPMPSPGHLPPGPFPSPHLPGPHPQSYHDHGAHLPPRPDIASSHMMSPPSGYPDHRPRREKNARNKNSKNGFPFDRRERRGPHHDRGREGIRHSHDNRPANSSPGPATRRDGSRPNMLEKRQTMVSGYNETSSHVSGSVEPSRSPKTDATHALKPPTPPKRSPTITGNRNGFGPNRPARESPVQARSSTLCDEDKHKKLNKNPSTKRKEKTPAEILAGPSPDILEAAQARENRRRNRDKPPREELLNGRADHFRKRPQVDHDGPLRDKKQRTYVDDIGRNAASSSIPDDRRGPLHNTPDPLDKTPFHGHGAAPKLSPPSTPSKRRNSQDTSACPDEKQQQRAQEHSPPPESSHERSTSSELQIRSRRSSRQSSIISRPSSRNSVSSHATNESDLSSIDFELLGRPQRTREDRRRSPRRRDKPIPKRRQQSQVNAVYSRRW